MEALPVWRLKVLVQFVLALMPGGEFLNYCLQHAVGSYRPSNTRARVVELTGAISTIRRHMTLSGGTVVEVGTGWDAVGALTLYAAGVGSIHTFDHLRHARLSLIKGLLTQLDLEAANIASAAAVPVDEVQARIGALRTASTLDQLFDAAEIRYVAPGDATKTGLQDQSIDLFFSFAVMEHVPEDVLVRLTQEAQRILRPEGICYHLIGLGDHYRTGRGYVNFLKYPEWLWRLLVKNKFSYHNRLREKQFVEMFTASGANMIAIKTELDPNDLRFLRSITVDRRFAGMTPEELAPWRTELVFDFPAGR